MGILDVDRRILTLGLARMVDSFGNTFLIVVLPLYITSGVVSGDGFGLAPALITGIVISAYGYFSSALQPFAGNLSDRTGRRRVFILAGLLVLAVSNFAYSLAGSYSTILLVRIGQGLGVALTVPATLALVNELSTDGERGESMGVFNTFRMLGLGLGPIVAGAIVSAGPYAILGVQFSGFDAAFYVASLSAFLSVLLVLVLVEDPEVDSGEEADAGEDLSIAVRDREGDHVLDPVFTLGLATAAMAICVSLLEPLQPQVNTALGQGATLFGIEFAAFTITQVVFQAAIGRWSDEYGRKPFILGALVLLAPATLAQGFVTTPIGMIAMRFVQGACGAAILAPAMALAGDLAQGRNSGTTLSVLTMAFGVGFGTGPLAAGYLAGLSAPVGQSYVLVFVFGTILTLISAGLVYTQVEETVERNESPSHVTEPAPTD